MNEKVRGTLYFNFQSNESFVRRFNCRKRLAFFEKTSFPSFCCNTMNETKQLELTALVEWIRTFPQLEHLQNEKENSNSLDLIADPQITRYVYSAVPYHS